MIRTCDGTDPNLLKPAPPVEVPCSTCPGGVRLRDRYAPCDCGLTFDDVDRTVIWPHARIPTREEKDAAYGRLMKAFRRELTEADDPNDPDFL